MLLRRVDDDFVRDVSTMPTPSYFNACAVALTVAQAFPVFDRLFVAASIELWAVRSSRRPYAKRGIADGGDARPISCAK